MRKDQEPCEQAAAAVCDIFHRVYSVYIVVIFLHDIIKANDTVLHTMMLAY
jgi:hypothetical protein